MASELTPSSSGARRAERWKKRPLLAGALRASIVLAPIGVSVSSVWAMSRWLPASRVGLAHWLWTILVVSTAMGVLIGVERLARRVLPLVVLLRLSLAFPGRAPSRFRAGLRRTNDGTLKESLEHLECPGRHEPGQYCDLLIQLLLNLRSHDALTRGHSERVRAYAELIGDQLGLTEEDLDKLRWAALLHDIGKLDVPADILQKTTAPDTQEWALLKTHPAAGAAMLEPLRPWLGEWVRAAWEHHMWWDGSGHPADLAKTEISLAGRIVAVADAYDVLSSARSYKAALPPDMARDELTDKAGTQFDPVVVRAFLDVSVAKVRAVGGPFGTIANTIAALQLPKLPMPAIVTTGTATLLVALLGWGGPMSAREAPQLLAMVDETTPRELRVASPVNGFAEVTVGLPAGEGQTSFRLSDPLHGTLVMGRTQVWTQETEGSWVNDSWELQVTYVPDDGFMGEDSFAWQGCDEGNTCRSGKVYVVVGAGLAEPDQPDSSEVAAAMPEHPVDPGSGDTALGQPVPPTPPSIDMRTVPVPTATPTPTSFTLAFATPGPTPTAAPASDETVDPAPEPTVAERPVSTPTSPPAPPPVTPTQVPVPTATPSATPTPAATPTPTAPPSPTATPSSGVPVVHSDSAVARSGKQVLVDVLANDVDPQGAALVIVSMTQAGHGVVSLSANQIRYRADDGYVGSDQFTYTVSDGEFTASAAVTVAVEPN